MIDLEKLNAELEKVTLEDCLYNKERLDKFFKLLSVKQALVQIEQAKAQAEFFESMANMQNKIDPSIISNLMKNNSLQDLVSKISGQ